MFGPCTPGRRSASPRPTSSTPSTVPTSTRLPAYSLTFGSHTLRPIDTVQAQVATRRSHVARIPLDTARNSLLAGAVAWSSRRRLGKVAAPLAAFAHHSGVLLVNARMELGVSRSLAARRLHAPVPRSHDRSSADRLRLVHGLWLLGVLPPRCRPDEDRPRSSWRQSHVYNDLERLSAWFWSTRRP
jgi:hypothetical protein